jgi:hypothetical protein
MRIRSRVDQLGINPKSIACSLDASLQQMSNAELPPDLM